MSETALAQDAPQAVAENVEVTEDGTLQVAEPDQTGNPKAAEKQPITAGQLDDDTPTESDILSDEEWERLSKKKRKFKFEDGEEEELTLADLYRTGGTNKSITKKAQMTAEEKRGIDADKAQLAGFLTNLKNNPEQAFDLLAQLGHDQDAIDKLAIMRAHKRMQFEKMTPEQKDELRIRQENEEIKTKLQTYEEREQQIAAQQQEQITFNEAKSDLDAALAELGEVNYLNIDRIAQMSQALYYKLKRKPSPSEVAKAVRQNFDQDITAHYQKTQAEEILSRLPDETKRKMRKLMLEMEAPRLPHGSSPMGSNPAPTSAKKPKGINDWFNNLGK